MKRMKSMAHVARQLALICGLGVVGGVPAGCATSGAVRTTLQSGGGTRAVFAKRSYDEVFRAALSVMSSKFTITEQQPAEGIILGEARAGMTTWGEVVGVHVTRVGQDLIEVRAVSQKRSRIQLTGQDWEKTVIAGIQAALGSDHG